MSVVAADIETALGRTLTDIETAQAAQWIGDAMMLVTVRLGDPALLNQTALDYVTREAVVARFRNPEGYEYEAIDDYRYGLPKESRRVTILDEWWRLLSPAISSSAFTMQVSSPLDLA